MPPEFEEDATPHEAAPAINDSGGGMFTQDANGEIFLEGVMTNVTHPGDSSPFLNTNYGSMIYVLGLNPAQLDWIDDHVSLSLFSDWNNDGQIDTVDIFSFLSSWHAFDADINEDGVTDLRDLFDFLNYWFARR